MEQTREPQVLAALAREADASLDLGSFRERSLQRGVNPLIYWTLRAILVPFFLVYLRMQRIGREHLPRSGPLILASNHRSFLDPFVIGTLVRRPVYYMAKRELFEKPLAGWLLNAPRRVPGRSRRRRSATRWTPPARSSRAATASWSSPRARACARAASATRAAASAASRSQTGAPVAPDRGARHRAGAPRLAHTPAQGRACGSAARFCSRASRARSPALAAAVTERIWACVSLQWDWLGGAEASSRSSHPAHRRARSRVRHDRARRARAIVQG